MSKEKKSLSVGEELFKRRNELEDILFEYVKRVADGNCTDAETKTLPQIAEVLKELILL